MGLFEQERKNACGVPEGRQPLDALGALLGATFILDGSLRVHRRIKKKEDAVGWALLEIGLGAIMSFIHVQRFLEAKPAYCADVWCEAARTMLAQDQEPGHNPQYWTWM